jgi:thiamine pyrophosphate-dependent acetolactate synthase large subunit-like protein
MEVEHRADVRETRAAGHCARLLHGHAAAARPVLVSIPADDWTHRCEPVAPRRVSTETRPEPQVLAAFGDAVYAASSAKRA